MDELKFVGGLDDSLWLNNGKELSRNYSQGYRVYDSSSIANTIASNGGGPGGASGLYLVHTNEQWEYLNCFYDVYNDYLREDVCGTLTCKGNTNLTACGTYLVFRKRK